MGKATGRRHDESEGAEMNVKNALYLFVEKIALLHTSDEVQGDVPQCDERFWDEIIIDARKLISDEISQDANPTEQPSETCKWRWGKIGGRINPHFTDVTEWSETFTYCPTCGKKIEVVE